MNDATACRPYTPCLPTYHTKTNVASGCTRIACCPTTWSLCYSTVVVPDWFFYRSSELNDMPRGDVGRFFAGVCSAYAGIAVPARIAPG